MRCYLSYILNHNTLENKNIISVVIPCRNEKNYIDRCLQSFITCDYPKDKLQVMVCDGLSDDGTADIIKTYAAKYAFIFYVENPHKITPFAMNLGIRHKPCDYVLIMSAHAEIEPDYISKCKTLIDSMPEVGCVGGFVTNVFQTPVSKCIGMAMASPFGVGNAHFRTGAREGFVDTVGTPFYKKEVLDKVGLFNETLVRNQDDELNYRVIKAGYKIYFTKATGMKYYVRASFKKMFKQYFQYGYWKVYVNRMHRTVTTVRQLIPAGFVLFLVLGGILSLLVSAFYIFYLVMLGLYLLLGALMAFRKTSKPNEALQVWWAFTLLHTSYGLGYLKGIWQFILLNKKPGEKQKALTR